LSHFGKLVHRCRVDSYHQRKITFNSVISGRSIHIHFRHRHFIGIERRMTAVATELSLAAMQRSHELLDAYTPMFQDIQEGRITSANDFLSDSDEVSGIGTDPSEWWMGRENLTPALEAQFAGFRRLGGTFNTSNAEA
jgi:hypothetical protein